MHIWTRQQVRPVLIVSQSCNEPNVHVVDDRRLPSQESVTETRQVKWERNWRAYDKLYCSRCSVNSKHTTWDLRRGTSAVQIPCVKRRSGESLEKAHCFRHSEALREKDSLGLDFPFPKIIFCSSFCCLCRSCSSFIRSSWIFLCSSTIRSWSSA